MIHSQAILTLATYSKLFAPLRTTPTEIYLLITLSAMFLPCFCIMARLIQAIAKGRTVIPIIEKLRAWGTAFREDKLTRLK